MVLRIRAEEFNPNDLKAGSTVALFLDLTPSASGEPDSIPVLEATGLKPGKTLVVMAGVHGDEYEGVRAIQDVFRQLDPQIMSGRLVAVPVANLSAYLVGNRISPADHLNLARIFPGNPNGSTTERLAYHLGKSIIAHGDFFVDLHSAGIKYQFPALVGYDASDTVPGKISKEAALVFGAPVTWGHPKISPGRSISEAASRRIPWLYTEASGAGRIAPEDLRHFSTGLLNLRPPDLGEF